MTDTLHYFSVYEKEFERELNNINKKIENNSNTLVPNQQKSFVIDVENAFNETQVTVTFSFLFGLVATNGTRNSCTFSTNSQDIFRQTSKLPDSVQPIQGEICKYIHLIFRGFIV